jgi:hypothetical protein
MDHPNAFIGCKTPPTKMDLAPCLGPALPVWNELLAWLESQGIAGGEWKSVSPKYGRGLRPALGKRTILYLGPCQQCFRASFVLGDRAVAAGANQQLTQKPAEGDCGGEAIRILVRKPADLAAARKLVEIKLAN